MPDLEIRLPVNDGSGPAYEVRINDGGADGGSTSQFYIGGLPGSFGGEDLDTAVQAFADSLGSIPNASIVGITRLTVSGASL